jgi:hypothetical protein
VILVLDIKRKPNYTDWMSHRMPAVEPVFDNLERNKGLKRF